jgi:hypothetical protein
MTDQDEIFIRATGPTIWARPNMQVTFRAEIMPGVPKEERTFRIERVMENGRVELEDFHGEYRESAFEAIRFDRDSATDQTS